MVCGNNSVAVFQIEAEPTAEYCGTWRLGEALSSRLAQHATGEIRSLRVGIPTGLRGRLQLGIRPYTLFQ